MKTPKELCGAELTEGAAAGGTCPQCGYVSASAAFCPNDGRRLLDHEFIWRADALDCSVCGQPHSGCDIVYGNPAPNDVRRDEAEASISPQEAYDSLLALIEEAGSNNHLDDVDCSNLVFYAEVLKPRASTRPEQQSAGEPNDVRRGRPVTHDEAEASLQRLINSHFGLKPGARTSVPVDYRDDDVVLADYIREQRALHWLKPEPQSAGEPRR